MWYEDRPHLRQKVCVLLWRFPNAWVPLVIVPGTMKLLNMYYEKDNEGGKDQKGYISYVSEASQKKTKFHINLQRITIKNQDNV